MRSVAAVWAALAASSQTARGLTIGSSGCDGREERPVRVVGVAGAFCVPLQPCEGSVRTAANGPLACPREGQRTVVGEAALTRDSCCAVVDSVSGALGCVLLARGAEEQQWTCLPRAKWPRGREFSRLSRRRKRSRMVQNLAEDAVFRASLVPTGSTHKAHVTMTATESIAPSPATTRSTTTGPASVATTTDLAATTPSATPAPAPLFTAAPSTATTSSSVALTTSTPVSATAALATPAVPVNISSVSATAATPAPFSVVPVSTTEMATSTIHSASPTTPSESSSSSEYSKPTSSPPHTAMPLPESGFNTDGASLAQPTAILTTTPSVTARPPSEPHSDSGSNDQSATTIPFPIEPVSAPSFGFGGGENAGLSLRCSPASAVGSASVGDELTGITVTSAVDCGASGSAGSLSASGSLLDESVFTDTSGISSETEFLQSTGSASLGSDSSDEATGASSNGSLAPSSSLKIALSSASSSLGCTELCDSGPTAGNSEKNGSLDTSGVSSVEPSSGTKYVESSSSLSRSSSSASGPSFSSQSYPLSPSSSSVTYSSSGSLEIKHLAPLPADSILVDGVLQLVPITDDSRSRDGSTLSPVNGGDTGTSNALGSNVMLFLTVASVAVLALIFGIVYLRPKRANPHELLTVLTPREPPPPMDPTGAYPYDRSLESEPAGPYDASNTPRQ